MRGKDHASKELFSIVGGDNNTDCCKRFYNLYFFIKTHCGERNFTEKVKFPF